MVVVVAQSLFPGEAFPSSFLPPDPKASEFASPPLNSTFGQPYQHTIIVVSITNLPCAPNLSTPSATRLPAHLVFGSSRKRCVRRCYLSATLLSPPFWGPFRLPLIARTAPFPSLGALGLLHLPCSVRLDCITQDHAAGRRNPAWTKQTSRVRTRQTTGFLCALVHCFCL